MNKEEEILAQLQKIRSFQETYHQEWKETIERMEQERKAYIAEHEQRVNKSVRKARYFSIVLLVLLGLVVFSTFYPASLFWPEWDRTYSYLEDIEYSEAREWLKNNESPSPLAGNRFGKKENAVDFIEKLYEAGAEAVYVVNADNTQELIDEEGGPYADSLVIVLPSEKEKRKEIFTVFNEESRREGFDSMNDMGQKELFFWWD